MPKASSVTSPLVTAAPPVWAVVGAWLRRATEVITASEEALNAINVFPVCDSDTGTNLRLTLAGITQAVPDLDGADPDLIVQAAILSAHGNSGAILAEMISSGCRALNAAPTSLAAGEAVASVLRTVARAATQAVARPVAGTILTVADAAADGAEGAAATSPTEPLVVARAAQREAADALRRTPELLDVLAAAGVVDAGGQAYLLLLDVLVEVLGGPPAQPLTSTGSATAPPSAHPARDLTLEYEVMYALRGAHPSDLASLRAELSGQGSSVVVVGDGAVAQVHVHLRDAGAAVEAGLARGALSALRITALAPTTTAVRTVVAAVTGPGLADAVRSLGGVPVLPAGPHVTAGELAVVLRACEGDLVVLPNDMEALEIATHLATQLRGPDRRIAVIPTVAQIQGLAAMAVHEPSADFDSAVVAMSSTAGHARHGAVTVAESRAMTIAGRCEVGDVLGLVDGDFVEIGRSLTDVAWRVIERLRGLGGGELLSVVTGQNCGESVVAELRRRLARESLEVEVIDGGQRRYPLLLGLE